MAVSAITSADLGKVLQIAFTRGMAKNFSSDSRDFEFMQSFRRNDIGPARQINFYQQEDDDLDVFIGKHEHDFPDRCVVVNAGETLTATNTNTNVQLTMTLVGYYYDVQ